MSPVLEFLRPIRKKLSVMKTLLASEAKKKKKNPLLYNTDFVKVVGYLGLLYGVYDC